MTEHDVAVLNERIDGLVKFFKSRLDSLEKDVAGERTARLADVALAKDNLDHRLEAMNNLDRRIAEKEVAAGERMELRLRPIEKAIDELAGAAKQGAVNLATAVAIAGIILSLAAIAVAVIR